ncbi:hypothetical protein [Luteolibacter sp. Populi]|uniref:hypothetical protein n=1 Tax=Luteolibacter sp. Populi TaxID=3230487 RepID=UPI0034659547
MNKPLPTGTPIAGAEAFLTEFARTFVHKAFRERFVHEALKKNARLHSRICHEIEDVFPTSCAGGEPSFAADDPCIPICGTACDLQETRWVDLSVYVKRGFGALIASAAGDRFYAETESDYGFPYKTYTGSKHRAASA